MDSRLQKQRNPNRITEAAWGGSHHEHKGDPIHRAISKVEASHKLVCLNQDGLGDTGASAVAEVLKDHANITTIHLEHNQIGDMGAQCFGSLLHNNYVITLLNLSNNAICDLGMEAICNALHTNHSLQHLKLAWNSISSSGMVPLASALESNCSLLTIDLRWNQITDDGCQAIIEGLHANDVVSDINLRWNPVNDKKLTEIKSLLKQTRTMYRREYLDKKKEASKHILASKSSTDTKNLIHPTSYDPHTVQYPSSGNEMKVTNEVSKSELIPPPAQPSPLFVRRFVTVDVQTDDRDLGPSREEYSSLQSQLSSATEKYEMAMQTINKVQEEGSKTAADLNKQLAEKVQEIRQLEALTTSLEKDILRHEGTIQEKEALIRATEGNRAQFEATLKAMQEDMDHKLNEVKESKEVALDLLKNESKRMEHAHESEIKKIESQYKSQMETLREEISKLRLLPDMHHKELMQAKSDSSDLKLRHQELLARVNKEHTQHVDDIKRQHATEMDRVASRHKAELQDMALGHTKAFSGHSEKYLHEMDNLRSKYEAMLQEKDSQLRSKDFNLREALEEMEATKRDAEMEVTTLKTKHTVEAERWRQEGIKRDHEIEMMRLQHSHTLDENAKFIEKMGEFDKLKESKDDQLHKQKEQQLMHIIQEKDNVIDQRDKDLRKKEDEIEALGRTHRQAQNELQEAGKTREQELLAQYNNSLEMEQRRLERQFKEYQEQQQQDVMHFKSQMLENIAANQEDLLDTHQEVANMMSAELRNSMATLGPKNKKGGCKPGGCTIC